MGLQPAGRVALSGGQAPWPGGWVRGDGGGVSKGEAEADSHGNRDPITQVHMTKSTTPLKTEPDREKSCLENAPP